MSATKSKKTSLRKRVAQETGLPLDQSFEAQFRQMVYYRHRFLLDGGGEHLPLSDLLQRFAVQVLDKGLAANAADQPAHLSTMEERQRQRAERLAQGQATVERSVSQAKLARAMQRRALRAQTVALQRDTRELAQQRQAHLKRLRDTRPHPSVLFQDQYTERAVAQFQDLPLFHTTRDTPACHHSSLHHFVSRVAEHHHEHLARGGGRGRGGGSGSSADAGAEERFSAKDDGEEEEKEQ